MNITTMTMTMYDEVIAVWEAAGLIIDPIDDSRESIEGVLARNPNSCFVAMEHAKVVGAVLGVFNGRRMWMHHLAVIPSHQHKGIGKQLVCAVTSACKTLGCPKISLSVIYDNLKVAAFYQKYGFYPVTDSIWFSKKME